MDIEPILIVAGVVVPFVVSLLKRMYPRIEEFWAMATTALLCVLIVVAFRYVPEEIVQEALVIFGTSQLLYRGVMKPFSLDDRIESTQSK